MKFLTIIFFLISLLVLSSIYISPLDFWPISFISLSIPFIILFNIFLFVFFVLKRKFLAAFPLIVIILGFKFIISSYSFHFSSHKDEKETFSILSYNTSRLLKEDVYSDSFLPKADEMMAWLADQDADVKCFQEFYNNDESKYWNSVEKLSQNKAYHCFFSGAKVNHTTGEIGVAIFSKHPIVNKGEIIFSSNNFNRGNYADLVIKGDTIRVINIHLQSMEIKRAGISNKRTWDDMVEDFVFLYYRIKHGAIDRSLQTKILLDFIEESPYKVIVCGDFNETPYGYVYNAFKSKLNNSFEEAGKGFGFTYNGNTLFFLRIDNQFYSKGIEATNLKTYNTINYSDHFPIAAKYVFISN